MDLLDCIACAGFNTCSGKSADRSGLSRACRLLRRVVMGS